MSNGGRNRNRCVPAHVLERILRRECADREITIADIEKMLGYSEEGIRNSLRANYVGFDKVDFILTKLGLFHLWYTDPDLQEVYAYLDSLPEYTPAMAQKNKDSKRRYLERNPKPRNTGDCEYCGKRHKRKRTWNSKSFAKYCSAKCQESAWKEAA